MSHCWSQLGLEAIQNLLRILWNALWNSLPRSQLEGVIVYQFFFPTDCGIILGTQSPELLWICTYDWAPCVISGIGDAQDIRWKMWGVTLTMVCESGTIFYRCDWNQRRGWAGEQGTRSTWYRWYVVYNVFKGGLKCIYSQWSYYFRSWVLWN